MRIIICSVIMLIATLSSAYPDSDQIRKGNDLYREARYSEAIEVYKEALKTDKDNIKLAYNLALAYQKKRDFANAKRYYAKVINSYGNEEVKQKAYFNAGNLYYMQGNRNAAAQLWKKSLILDSEDEDSRYNLEVALAKQEKERRRRSSSVSNPGSKEDSTPADNNEQSGSSPGKEEDKSGSQDKKGQEKKKTGPAGIFDKIKDYFGKKDKEDQPETGNEGIPEGGEAINNSDSSSEVESVSEQENETPDSPDSSADDSEEGSDLTQDTGIAVDNEDEEDQGKSAEDAAQGQEGTEDGSAALALGDDELFEDASESSGNDTRSLDSNKDTEPENKTDSVNSQENDTEKTADTEVSERNIDKENASDGSKRPASAEEQPDNMLSRIRSFFSKEKPAAESTEKTASEKEMKNSENQYSDEPDQEENSSSADQENQEKSQLTGSNAPDSEKAVSQEEENPAGTEEQSFFDRLSSVFGKDKKSREKKNLPAEEAGPPAADQRNGGPELEAEKHSASENPEIAKEEESDVPEEETLYNEQGAGKDKKTAGEAPPSPELYSNAPSDQDGAGSYEEPPAGEDAGLIEDKDEESARSDSPPLKEYKSGEEKAGEDMPDPRVARKSSDNITPEQNEKKQDREDNFFDDIMPAVSRFFNKSASKPDSKPEEKARPEDTSDSGMMMSGTEEGSSKKDEEVSSFLDMMDSIEIESKGKKKFVWPEADVEKDW